MNENKFFQSETKFVQGKIYETIRVDSYNFPYESIENCDEVGRIIPNTELLLGRYVSSYHYGFGEGGGRCDHFINDKGEKISYHLNYDGTTRYREVQPIME